MTAPLLQLDTVTMQFGGLRCVSDFSFSVGEGELVGLGRFGGDQRADRKPFSC